MRSITFSFLCLLLAFFSLKGAAQLKLVTGERFLQGVSLKKVFVSVEDHTVWALTQDGKVYKKGATENDFQIYAPTAQITVAEITGYTEQEMYFLVRPDVIVHFKAGVKLEIKVPYPEVTRINNISIINEYKNTFYYQYYPTVPNTDYLAIATNKHMYKLFRGNTAVTATYNYDNQPVVSQPEWRITNTGNFSVDFQYTYPAYSCNFQPDRNTITFHTKLPYFFSGAIPDNGPYPSKINATLTGHYYIDPLTGNSDYLSRFYFWGTDEGLFVKASRDCPTSTIAKVIPNVIVNDLEEINALSPIAMQNYILAATDKGVYYTQESIFKDLNVLTNVQSIKFKTLQGFPIEKVYSICMDSQELVSVDFSSGVTYDTMCEKVAWVASETGLTKIYAVLEQEYFDDIRLANLFFSKPQSNTGDYTKAIFNTCGSESITVNTRIREDFDSQLLIQWFKDGQELPDLVGMKTVTFQESGEYSFTALVLCEGIKFKSIPIIINNNKGPIITFTYPPTVNICTNQSFVFETQLFTGYSYRWFKDNVQVANANLNKYTANVSGNYRVEVSSCSGAFESSANVKLNVLPTITPVINKDKVGYCKGETAKLTVANAEQLKTKWYLNEVELTEFSARNEIAVNVAGLYRVSFSNAANCETKATAVKVEFNEPPVVQLTRSSDRVLCHGETVRLTAVTTNGIKYLWNTGATTANIDVGTSGKYSVLVYGIGDCAVTSEQVEVVVNTALKEVKPVIVANKAIYCRDDNAVLSVNNQAAYPTKWFKNGTEITAFANRNSIEGLEAGNYEVEFLSGTCSSRSVVFPVVFSSPPDATITKNTAKTLCKGETLTLSVPYVAGNKYLWNTGQTSPVIIVAESGAYSVAISNEANCHSISEVLNVTINPRPNVPIIPPLNICQLLKEEIHLKAPEGYLYYIWNGVRTTKSTYLVTRTGDYTLTIEDENGCTTAATYKVLPYCKELMMPNSFSPNGDGVNDIWTVSGLENDPRAVIAIFNRMGARVHETNGTKAFWDGKTKNGHAPVGTYYSRGIKWLNPT
ncbi:MAG: gliding motility-associated C-terminal domain-containing protein [Pedobacter sp.]|nr:MAG: gliding motility-associated C-terminal domain-containing protein [Pedobacter sp.]